jgi:hypothetical protein
LGDLLIAQPRGHQLQHFQFAAGQRLD